MTDDENGLSAEEWTALAAWFREVGSGATPPLPTFFLPKKPSSLDLNAVRLADAFANALQYGQRMAADPRVASLAIYVEKEDASNEDFRWTSEVLSAHPSARSVEEMVRRTCRVLATQWDSDHKAFYMAVYFVAHGYVIAAAAALLTQDLTEPDRSRGQKDRADRTKGGQATRELPTLKDIIDAVRPLAEDATLTDSRVLALAGERLAARRGGAESNDPLKPFARTTIRKELVKHLGVNWREEIVKR